VYNVHNANRIKSAALVSMFFEYHSEGTGDATDVTTAGKINALFLMVYSYFQLRKLILIG